MQLRYASAVLRVSWVLRSKHSTLDSVLAITVAMYVSWLRALEVHLVRTKSPSVVQDQD